MTRIEIAKWNLIEMAKWLVEVTLRSSGFFSMKQLGALMPPPPPLDGMLVHRRVPNMKQLGELLFPPRWDASPWQGTQHEATRSSIVSPWMGC